MATEKKGIRDKMDKIIFKVGFLYLRLIFGH